MTSNSRAETTEGGYFFVSQLPDGKTEVVISSTSPLRHTFTAGEAERLARLLLGTETEPSPDRAPN